MNQAAGDRSISCPRLEIAFYNKRQHLELLLFGLSRPLGGRGGGFCGSGGAMLALVLAGLSGVPTARTADTHRVVAV
jgi:hypothetical protein